MNTLSPALSNLCVKHAETLTFHFFVVWWMLSKRCHNVRVYHVKRVSYERMSTVILAAGRCAYCFCFISMLEHQNDGKWRKTYILYVISVHIQQYLLQKTQTVYFCVVNGKSDIYISLFSKWARRWTLIQISEVFRIFNYHLVKIRLIRVDDIQTTLVAFSTPPPFQKITDSYRVIVLNRSTLFIF